MKTLQAGNNVYRKETEVRSIVQEFDLRGGKWREGNIGSGARVRSVGLQMSGLWCVTCLTSLTSVFPSIKLSYESLFLPYCDLVSIKQSLPGPELITC